MSIRKSEAGFSVVEFLIIFVVLGAISFMGYTFLNGANAQRAKLPAQATERATEAVSQEVPPAPAIEQTSDLDKASDTLDSINTDTSTESQQLDAEASTL